ncbi:hypothetical protein BC936DRAFT_146060 [Jimgerdemannia flammicorona]|uniref:GRAM domain-containing protein n=1 Tax=Jimgerdemannia flammicorona TaxID=994334 RepID=A0A433D8F7_9FUNG|nr:hypothetical protein BC936DRAFT_146060 [Jimgerdemannia flammicorona]
MEHIASHTAPTRCTRWRTTESRSRHSLPHTTHTTPQPNPMALNWAMLAEDRRNLVLLPGEKTFFTQENVRFELDCSGGYVYNLGRRKFVGLRLHCTSLKPFSLQRLTLENNSGYPGSSGGIYTSNKGVLYLTNQRVVFVSTPATEHLISVSIPLLNIKHGRFQQPWFAANYYEGTVMPCDVGGGSNLHLPSFIVPCPNQVPGGGLTQAGNMKIVFKDGGGFDFTTIYDNLLARLGETGETPQTFEPLPAYAPPMNASTPQQQPYYIPPSSSPYAAGYAPPPGPPPQSGQPIYGQPGQVVYVQSPIQGSLGYAQPGQQIYAPPPGPPPPEQQIYSPPPGPPPQVYDQLGQQIYTPPPGPPPPLHDHRSEVASSSSARVAPPVKPEELPPGYEDVVKEKEEKRGE